MTTRPDSSGNAPGSFPSEQSAALLRTILANVEQSTWHDDAPRVHSDWESFDLYDLRGCNLSGRDIGEVMLAECALDDADFSNAVLDKTMLQASSASRARFAGARLHLTQMIPFYGAHIDFRRAIFHRAFIQHAKLLDSHFDSARLEDVSLSHTDMSRSSLVGARFLNSRLDSVVLGDAELTQATFENCNLVWAVFRGAQMRGTLIEGCDMSGADFRGAHLDGARILGGSFGIVEQGDAITPTRFDDTPEARKLVANSQAANADLIEWHPAAATAHVFPRSVGAGQACPRSGFWFSPARAGSRRHFQAGQTFPDLESTYGATFWQWDQNQDPPRL